MPKQVDHEVRRRQIAAAVWRIIAERGLEAVSMREVSLEARVSVGAVQHYFASKDEVITFAASHLREQLSDRVARQVAAMPRPHTPLGLARAVLVALLPMDAAGRTASLVGNALSLRALREPGLTERYRKGSAEIVALVADHLAAAADDGEVRADLDATREAQILVALAGGLASAVVSGTCTGRAAIALVDHQLAALGPGAICG
jgi:AcrR family transcriptional regulator